MGIYWFDDIPYLLPGLVLSIWAQARILRAHAAGRRVPSGSGLTGAEAAQLVMRASGATGIDIEPAAGELSDHYDPANKVLRLSRAVCAGRSLAAIGVAAHEAGHAIQDASRYPGLVVRNVIVPLAGLGSQVVWLLIAAAMLLGMLRLFELAIVLFSTVVVLQVLNLPVELDASRRARQALRAAGLVNLEEEPVVARVMDTAALAHVAAALTGVLSLFAFLGRFGPSKNV
jgi:Zn-dependent membrane protease YugP